MIGKYETWEEVRRLKEIIESRRFVASATYRRPVAVDSDSDQPADRREVDWVTRTRDVFLPTYPWWRRLGATFRLWCLSRRRQVDADLRAGCRLMFLHPQAVGLAKVAKLLILLIVFGAVAFFILFFIWQTAALTMAAL